MLQSPSPPSHFISISSQEAGNNLQINCHFYGAEAAGWDSLCPPIKDDVAVKKIKGKFPLPRTLRPAHSVSLVCDARCLSGCGGGGVFSVSRLASPGCFPTYLRNALDIMRVGSECFWVGIHVLRSKCVPVLLLMKTWTSAHNLTGQHNYMKWKMCEKVIVNSFATILPWRQMCLCQRTPVSDVELWLEWLVECSLVSEAVVCPRAQWIEVVLYLIVLRE